MRYGTMWVAMASMALSVSGYTAPEIAVAGNWFEITDGDATPSSSNATLMGNVYIDNPVSTDNSKMVRIQIFNLGDQDLVLTNGPASFTGAGASDFATVHGSGPTSDSYVNPIPPGEVSHFSIRCKPSGPGQVTAVCHISSNDSNEADFDFTVEGTGVDEAIPAVPDVAFMWSPPPLVKVKSTSSGPLYKITGYFQCVNLRQPQTDMPFQTATYLSFDTFASTPDVSPPPLAKAIRKKLSQGKSKKVNYRFITDQNPYDGAIISVADSQGDIIETNDRNNRGGTLIRPPL